MSSDSPFVSLQMQGIAVVDVPIDEVAVAQRLSSVVKFRTQSNQDRTDFDEQAFRDFHAFLEQSFPRVHATLAPETIGDPRSLSLLFTWAGSDPMLTPVFLMGHQDVVPVVPGTEGQWEPTPRASSNSSRSCRPHRRPRRCCTPRPRSRCSTAR